MSDDFTWTKQLARFRLKKGSLRSTHVEAVEKTLTRLALKEEKKR